MSPQSDDLYYAQLEQGALYLAERAALPAERNRHLAMAACYHMRALGEPYPPLRTQR